MVRQASHAKLVRAAALMGAVLMALSFASAERHFIPGMKDATRGTVPVVRTGPNRWRGRAKAGAGQAAGGPGAVRVLLRHVLSFILPPPRFTTTPALVGRPHGAYAASGLPRRRRWATLGGHGRNGAG